MAVVVFWEKPGCINNTCQKAWLTESGHEVVARDLLAEPWTAQRLRAFFGTQPMAKWFNPVAPAITAGAVHPENLSESEALAAMCADPLLIRRPLMECGERRMAGFEADEVAAWIGLVGEGKGNVTDCPRPQGDPCAIPGTAN